MIADIPVAFRAACHWRLYVAAICGPDGLPAVSIPRGGSMEERLAAQKQRGEVMKIRAELYPGDDDGTA